MLRSSSFASPLNKQRRDRLTEIMAYIKIALIAFLIVPILVTMSACGDTASSSKIINSPVDIPYLVKNPLEVVTLEKTDVPEFYKRTITIKGLLDKKIEQSINDDLANIYANIIDGDLPPYRGIKQLVKNDAKLTSNTIDTNMSFNYNNVASISIYGNRNYANINYVGIMDAFNVDLNTGKQISLKDIFSDDVDYKAILNDYISKLLMKSNSADESDNYYGMGGPALRLVSPFKGIRDNQKFFLYPGGLVLIFDYSNPEFDTGLYATTVYVTFQELGNSVAITERFYDPNVSIYDGNKPLVYEFLQSSNSSDIKKQKNEVIDNININQSLSYGNEIPPQAKIKAESLYPIDVEVLAKLKDLVDPSIDSWNSIEQYVWVSTYGQYSNVTRNTSMYFNNKWIANNENYCFDADGKIVELADIFVPGFDYKSKIMAGLKNAINQTSAPSEYDAESLYNSLQFSINGMDLSFTTEAVKFDESSNSPIYFALTYEEIGCDNLTIFK